MTALRTFHWITHILLGVGLTAPCMTVTPRLGAHSEIGHWLGLIDKPRTYSILSGIRDLITGHGPVVGAILLVFSVLFPIAKLVAIRFTLADHAAGQPRRPGLFLALGKYSMIDVFVIALLVVVSKSFPGGTEVTIRWGVYPFAAAALLSVAVSRRLALATVAPRWPHGRPLGYHQDRP